MVIPSQIRHGRWIILNSGEKCYIDDVDLDGKVSGIGHFAIHVVDKPGSANGRWIGTEKVKSVKGADPDKKNPPQVVDLGIASWRANKAGSIAEAQQVWNGDKINLGDKIFLKDGDVLTVTNDDYHRHLYVTSKKDKESFFTDISLIKNDIAKIQKSETEDIHVKVNKGDTILVGRFKNKAIKVKTIGTDERGLPTINGRKVLTFRIKKDMKEVQLNKIAGGTGDKHDSSEVNQDQLKVGIEVEKEHSPNSKIAAEVALDHLIENPNYYTELVDTDIADEPEAIAIAKQTGVSKKAEVYRGIDEPANLSELVNDIELLAKIDKLKDQVQKLQKIPTSDAFGVQKKIKQLQNQIKGFEHQLYGEFDLDNNNEIKSLTELIDNEIFN